MKKLIVIIAIALSLFGISLNKRVRVLQQADPTPVDILCPIGGYFDSYDPYIHWTFLTMGGFVFGTHTADLDGATCNYRVTGKSEGNGGFVELNAVLQDDPEQIDELVCCSEIFIQGLNSSTCDSIQGTSVCTYFGEEQIFPANLVKE